MGITGRGPQRIWKDGAVEVWRDEGVSAFVWCHTHRLVGIFDPRVPDELLRETAEWHLRKEHR